ncbi:MAG: anti-sigma regulatory factor [Candidatus Bathyarchaeota archaeon]
MEEIRTESDIVRCRSLARAFAGRLGFGKVDQTRITTAVSEIARNTLVHGGGGSMTIRVVEGNGLEVLFVDAGPGIQDIDLAMRDGYSTAGSLGLGLGGARRLIDEFSLESKVGAGTRVTMRKYPSKQAWG